MKSQRAPFLPVVGDIDDDKLEQLARDKGVGSLVKTTTNQNKAGQGAAAEKPAQVDVGVEAAAGSDAADASAATPRSRMKTVNLELPDYVWTELKIRAAHKQTSVKHIVMTALKADGITIAEADMIEDGRRIRT
jgi:hypothetical protein